MVSDSLREVVYQKEFASKKYCILGADIGGTNSNFGFFELRGTQPALLLSVHAQSQTVTDFAQLTKSVLQYVHEKHGIIISDACFGVAGMVNPQRDYVKPTNLTVPVDAQAIRAQTGLNSLALINDFEAVGLGIDLLDPASIITINAGMPHLNAQKACIGAGTGMGKAALLWNNHFKRYLPFASEGGHSDCSAQTLREFALFEYINKLKEHSCPVSWEDVLSGRGITRIYQFLGTQKQYDDTAISVEIAATGFKADLISWYAFKDERCFDTFTLYTIFYARCAKNFVLDTLALNGLYIAGGIAAKNVAMFKEPAFMQEFIKCGKQSELLQNVPVYVVADYNVSLYGAAAFIQLSQQGIL